MLGDILEDIGTKTLKYLDDFGDGWEHTFKIERLVDPKPAMLYPSLDRGQGPLPTRGRRWSLGLWRAPRGPSPIHSHERHGEFKEWFADDFNPDVVDVDRLSEKVAYLAESWSRRSAVKRRRTA